LCYSLPILLPDLSSGAVSLPTHTPNIHINALLATLDHSPTSPV
jgi:hypothetical protein